MTAIDQASALRGLVNQYERQRETPAGHRAATAPEAAPRLARTIAITSGKGGVGKTTVSVNLAIQLTRLGRRVALLDADLGTANADVICNVQASATLAHVIAGQRQLADIMIPAPGGFTLIPGVSGLADVTHLQPHEQQRLARQIADLESSFDVLLIDTGAGIGPDVMTFCNAAERVLVVTTPEPTSITDAYAVIKSIHNQAADADVRLLINMVADEREARSVFNRIVQVSQRFINLSPGYAGCVVTDSQVPLAVRRRHPLVLDAPKCKAGQCLLSLAHRMDLHAASKTPRRKTLLQRLRFGRRT